jgi:predicted dehydrogenase
VAIRVLQCGAGIRGNHWAQFVRERPDFECVGVVDTDPAALDRIRATVQSDACRYFSGLDQALEQADADAALIVSPSALHASHAIRCLEAGLTVMVEKPFGTSVAEAEKVLERARALDKQVIIAENYRFFPAERTVRKLLSEGFLGALDNATLIDRRRMPSHTEGPWLASIDYPHLQEVAIHHFDSLRSLFEPPPGSITARVWNPPWTDYKHGSNTQALIDFGDIRVQYLGTMLSHRFGFSLWIEGERGVIWTNRKYVAWRPKGSRWFRPIRNVKVPPGDEKKYPQGGTTSLLNSLRDAVRDGIPAETRGEDNIWTVAMVEAAKLSDRERRTVDIAEVYAGPAAG